MLLGECLLLARSGRSPKSLRKRGANNGKDGGNVRIVKLRFLDPCDATSAEVAQLMLGSRTAWPYNFDTARHHDDVPAASTNRMVSRSALHSFAAARHELKQLPPQQHA
jgi:hypothetical protein